VDADLITGRLNERGVSSVQFLVASALALILFVTFANVVAVQYGRGAIRSGLEQGARAGGIAVSATQCESVARDVIGQLLGGRMSDSLVVRCEASGTIMVASASAVFESWSVLTPDFSVALEAEAVIDPGP